MQQVFLRKNKNISMVKKDLISVFIVITSSLLLWSHIPFLQFIGEGFYYFERINPKGENIYELITNTLNSLNYDAFAQILFGILIPIFKDKVSHYMWFEFIYMIIIDIVLFFAARLLTSSRMVGLLAAILFSTSFIGKYDMFSNGGYQYFAQRATPLLPLLISFIFLSLYLTKKSLLFYLISIALYTLAIIMGFFGTIFIPVFIFYPIIQGIIKTSHPKKIIRFFLIPIPFVLINWFVVKDNSYSSSKDTLFELLFYQTGFLVNGIMKQLSVITLPVNGFDWLSNYLQKSDIFFFIGLIYFSAIYLVWKLHKKWLGLVISSLFSTLSMLFLNLKLNSHEVLSTSGSTRYFYYPMVTLAIFWSLVGTSLFYTKKGIYKYSLIVFFIAWFYQNSLGIKQNLELNNLSHKNNEIITSYLRYWSNEIKKNPSYVYLPSSIGTYGAGFVFKFFSHPEGIFAIEGFKNLDLNELVDKDIDPESLYVLQIDSETGLVTDKSRIIRSELKKMKNEIIEKY